ncbi:nuclear transport factor 2 family protein [Nonomuraea sp. NPDC050536]|uniref:nuclear transport factor 2 family protein n=1 Tax=Nonomuraea sp. NPDC050536 TaxID=3364366 RepID=UPI0037C76571
MTAELFERQLALIADGDLEGLLAQYHEEATVVRFDRVAHGPEEIRDFFAAYLALKPTVDQVKSRQIAGDVILYNADMTIGGNQVNAFGTLIVKDGKVWRQTAAATPR